MVEKIDLIPERHLQVLRNSLRKYRLGILGLVVAWGFLAGYIVVLKQELYTEKTAWAGVYDDIYENVMKEYDSVRDDPYLRRYIMAKIVSMAREEGIDPDLIFSLVAIESSFNVVAKSQRNARGLGQVMYKTAQSLDPTGLRSPDDLYHPHLNLKYALQYLRANLERSGSDKRESLMVYYYGEAARAPGFVDYDRYADKVLTFYSRIKRLRGTSPTKEAAVPGFLSLLLAPSAI